MDLDRTRAAPHLVALVCVAGGVLLRIVLEPLLDNTQVWLTFWPASFLAWWFGGARGAVTAVVASVIVVWGFLIEGLTVMTPTGAIVGTFVFTICGIGASCLAELVRRARADERRMRDAAEASQREALAANRAKDEFLAVLGHELRNPLAPVASAALLLRNGLPESPELDVIDRQVKHMARLIDDLLDLSRVVRGQLELQRQVSDLRSLVEQAIEMLSPQRARSGHRLEIDVPAGIPVEVDPSRMVQVITNVLGNAIKYSPAGEPIRVEACRQAGQVTLSITDRGIGMDEALLSRAFEPFVQGAQDSARPRGGLGLGLAISRRLVDLHGGAISASSAPGEGTRIEITLPAAAHEPRAAQVDKRRSAQGEQRILVVDDNEDAAVMLAELLAVRGHVTKVAFDGPSGLALLETFQPTLALLDIGLPGMDGHELARQMRERGFGAMLVAITGYGRETDRACALASGFNEHLVEPVSAERLDELIRSASRFPEPSAA